MFKYPFVCVRYCERLSEEQERSFCVGRCGIQIMSGNISTSDFDCDS